MFSPLMLRWMFGDSTALPLLTSAFFPSFVDPRAASHSPRRHFELQQAVVADLGPNQNKLHERSMAEWADLLKDTSRRVVSVERDGVLIAQAVVLLPQMAEDTDMLDMELPDEPHRVATVCSVVTHPTYRCRALMLELLNKAQQVAWLNNRHHMLALITDDNIRSWSQFLRAGYQIVGCGFDPVDGSNAFLPINPYRG